MPPTDDIRDACERYLSQKHTTLWADWDITRPDRREKAIDWLCAQVQGVAEFYDPPTYTGRSRFYEDYFRPTADGLPEGRVPHAAV